MSSVSRAGVDPKRIWFTGCRLKNSAGPTQGWCGLWKPAAMKKGLSLFSAISCTTRVAGVPSGVMRDDSSVARHDNGSPAARPLGASTSARDMPSFDALVQVLSRTSDRSWPGSYPGTCRRTAGSRDNANFETSQSIACSKMLCMTLPTRAVK